MPALGKAQMDNPKKRVIKKTVPVNTIVALPTSNAKPEPEVKPEVKPQCAICVEPYNKAANTEIKCCFCEKSACRRCIQIFLTTSTNDPHCMHCSRGWEREFVDDNLTMTYRMGDYKKHRENVLLDREIALMPATQYRAEQIRSAEKMERELIPPFDKDLKDLYAKQAEINKEINRVYTLRADAYYQIRLLRDGRGEKAKSESTFVRKCPDAECRGFLSSAWKCGLCSKWACPECHEIKGDNRDAEHTCNPDNVATAKLLAKDSRPCPGCAVLITKIEGCDQMWCPECHTAFSWRTGQKESGVVHNPHFYEWQRKQNGGVAPRVLGDVACGGIPTYHDVRDRIKSALNAKEQECVLNFHRIVQHVQHVELQRYHNVFNELDNQDLRIHYLLGQSTADMLKVAVQAREKKREKERAIRRAMEVLVQAGTDLLRRIMAETDVAKKRAIIEEIDALRIYINELLEKVNERMKLSVPQYSSNWMTTYPFSASAKKAKKIEDEKRLKKINELKEKLKENEQEMARIAALDAAAGPSTAPATVNVTEIMRAAVTATNLETAPPRGTHLVMAADMIRAARADTDITATATLLNIR